MRSNGSIAKISSMATRTCRSRTWNGRGPADWGRGIASAKEWQPPERASESPRGGIRVGDRDRAEVANRLSTHAAEGRLSLEELEARLELANASQFRHELVALEGDMPARPNAPGRWRLSAAGVLVAIVLAAALSVLVKHPVLPLFVVAGLIWRGWWQPRGYRQADPSSQRLGESSARRRERDLRAQA